MRKLLLILICLSLLLGNVFAASDEISNMDAQITVDSNGTCRVTVLAEVRFSDRPTTFLFPLGSDAKDITASGASYNQKTIDGVKCIVFENESGFAGTITFQCSYTLPCTMTESGSGQHFTAKLPERGWEYPINRYKLTVTFPEDITAFPRWQSSYYGDVIDNYLNIQVNNNTVTAKSNIVFRDHETLTMKLDFEPQIFDLKHLAEKSVSFDRMIFVALFVICIGYWLIALAKGWIRKPKKLTFLYRASAGEVPCQLFGDKADIGALIAHWGTLGYIILRRTRSGQFRLEQQMPMGNERSAAERRIFKSLFRASTTTVLVASNRFMAAVNTEAPVLRIHWKNRMFRKKDGRPDIFLRLCLATGFFFSLMLFDTLLASNAGRWFWIIVLTLLTLPLYALLQKVVPHWYRPTGWIYLGIGVAVIFVLYLCAIPAECGGFLFFTVLLQLTAGLVTRFGGQRTVPGLEVVYELLHLRRTIALSTRKSAKDEVRRDSQYYYRTLPYAEILGVGNRFRKNFGGVTTESCPWFIDDRDPSPSPITFYKIYKEYVQLIRRAQWSILLQSLTKSIPLTLPRIRPTSHSRSTGGHNRRSSSSSQVNRNRSVPRRPSPGRTASPEYSNHYRPEPRHNDLPRKHHSPQRTQHRANPVHTGRRS